ncbi:MAG: PAS domain S-box protein [Brevinematales bacterium]|nr:PAS domain S-box protein [Brevinematales bacterium]
MQEIKDQNGHSSIHISYLKDISKIVSIGFVYFLAHKISFFFPDTQKILMAIWPAGGIGLAALLLNPKRLWPAILITLFIAGNTANLIEGRPLLNSLGFMTANILESFGSAWLITRLCGQKIRFTRIKEIFALILAATVLNFFTGLLGAGTAALSNTASFWSFLGAWWIADGLGILIVTPFIVSWSDFKDFKFKKDWKWIIESTVFIIGWCIVSQMIFNTHKTTSLLYPQPYFLYLLLIWGSLRLGIKSVTLALAAGFVIAVTGNAVTSGPLLWGGDTFTDRVILAQMFMGVASFAGLILAATIKEKSSVEISAHEERERIKSLGDNIQNGMVYQIISDKGKSRKFQYVSAGMERINGVTVAEVLNDANALYNLFIEEDRAKVAELEDAALKAMSQFHAIVRLRKPDGQLRWMEFSSFPTVLPDGLIRWDGIQMDVTERMKAEEALCENEIIFSSFMEHSPVYVFFKDKNIRSLRLSRNYEQMLGMPLEDALGKNMDELFPSDLAKSMVEDDKRILEKGEVVKIIEELAGKTYETTKFPVFIDGKPNMLAGFTLDISERVASEQERKKLQEQLQQAMKMEAVGRLAGGIAHDFNNLLTAIQGNIEIAKLDLSPHDPQIIHLDEAMNAVDSAVSLTRQLLTFSRKQVIEPNVLNLNDIINNLRKMLHRLIGENIKVQSIVEDNLWSVKVDAGQFEQVIINLAINSRDAMPDGGELIIETANVILDEEYSKTHPLIQPGEYILLQISDTGIGMSNEVKDHLFEPFFTTKPQGLGTGLGLATIFGIVRQAGGSIEVYSEHGKGTAFKIYLPKFDEAAVKLRFDGSEEDLPGGNEAILLVEDEANVLRLTLSILERLGYQVFSASSAEEALIFTEGNKTPIDLLITDVVMPGMNGRELAEKMVKILPEIKVLFTSGYPENVIAHHGILDENLNFIGKPYTMSALAKKIRDVIGKDSVS